MSLGYVLKQYQPKKVVYSKILSVRRDKKKLILWLLTGTEK